MPKKVLVVDDDVKTVTFLSAALEENGYEAVGAHNGQEGLEKIKSEHPDLVILDVMMPKKTGFVLFKQIRRDDNFKELPVIMLTGNSEDDNVKRAMELGIKGYLLKPVSKKALLTRIVHALK